MRAVPFEVVCLLGMNDGDYPRSASRSDFDLMAWPGQRRPGDRSRRDDDRYLMLEALLSARRVLYVSWTGRSARDNSEQPPSVLVSQLRDYLTAGWGTAAVGQRTTEHPLQPFSRRYFEPGPDGDGQGPRRAALFTFAREWRAAHMRSDAPDGSAALRPSRGALVPSADTPLTVQTLARFLRDPVKTYFRDRLDVRFDEVEATLNDDEAFVVGGLDLYQLLAELVDAAQTPQDVQDQADRIQRSGRLPMGLQGEHARRELIDTVTPMLAARAELRAAYPVAAPKEALRFESSGIVLEDWQVGTAARADVAAPSECVHIDLSVSRLTGGKGEVRAGRLIDAYVRMLADTACGRPRRLVRVGRDAVLTMEPLAQPRATELLGHLLDAWRQGMVAPLPIACDTAIGLVSGLDIDKVVEIYEGAHASTAEVDRDPCLARVFPTYDELDREGRFETWARHLFAPLLEWAQSNVTARSHSPVEEAAS